MLSPGRKKVSFADDGGSPARPASRGEERKDEKKEEKSEEKREEKKEEKKEASLSLTPGGLEAPKKDTGATSPRSPKSRRTSNTPSPNVKNKPAPKDELLHKLLFYEEMPRLGGLSVPGGITRIAEGQYLFGSKKVNMAVLSEKLVVMVGGGNMPFADWVHKYGPSWLNSKESEGHDVEACGAERRQLHEKVQELEKQLNIVRREFKEYKESTEKALHDATHNADGRYAAERLKWEREKAEEAEKHAKTKAALQHAYEETKRLLEVQTQLTTALSEMSEKYQAVSKELTEISFKLPLYTRLGFSPAVAPIGTVTLVFTDVQGSTAQWESDPESMATCLQLHNDLMRTIIRECSGYEVKTEGDAFMVSFSDPVQAYKFCLSVQERLLTLPWPDEIYHQSDSKIEISNSKPIYRGLRVRMGIHRGNPLCSEDPVTGRMDYLGPVVNRAARVSSVAHGGQIVISDTIHEVVANKGKQAPRALIEEIGAVKLKGISTPTRIYQVLPVSLGDRTFPKPETVDLENGATPKISRSKTLNDTLRSLKTSSSSLGDSVKTVNQKAEKVQERAEHLSVWITELEDEGGSAVEVKATDESDEYRKQAEEAELRSKLAKEELTKLREQLDKESGQSESLQKTIEMLQQENETLRKQLMDSKPRPVYNTPTEPTTLEALLAKAVKEQELDPPSRITEDIYEFGKKRVKLLVAAGHLAVRIGGGIIQFEEWASKWLRRRKDTLTSASATNIAQQAGAVPALPATKSQPNLRLNSPTIRPQSPSRTSPLSDRAKLRTPPPNK